MAGYRPMTLADLAGYLSRAADDRTRWKLTWKFLEEYRWESSAVHLRQGRPGQAPRIRPPRPAGDSGITAPHLRHEGARRQDPRRR
jgi:hypothetical protein